jgi:hypothetical protein
MGEDRMVRVPVDERQITMKRPPPSKKPKDLADAFREVKRLRAEVARAEVLAQERRRSDGRCNIENDRQHHVDHAQDQGD